jgi:hypothetical protein
MNPAQRQFPPLKKGGQGGFQRRLRIDCRINPPPPPFCKGGRSSIEVQL